MQEKTAAQTQITTPTAPPAYTMSPPPDTRQQPRQTNQNGGRFTKPSRKARVPQIEEESNRQQALFSMFQSGPPQIPYQRVSNSQPETEEEHARIQREDSDPLIGLPSAFDQRQSMSPAALELARSQINPLATLFHYHITRKCPEFGSRNAFITGTSIVISGLSLVLYILPTANYAAKNSEFLGEPITTVTLEAGVTVANFNVSALATSEALTAFFGKKLSPEIRDIIDDENRSKFITVVRLGGFILGSFFAATPFGISVQGNLYEQMAVEVTTAIINFFGLNTFALTHYRELKKKVTRDERQLAIYELQDSFIFGLEEFVKEQLNSEVMDYCFTTRSESNANELLLQLAENRRIHFRYNPKVPERLTWKEYAARRIAPGIISSIIPIIGMIPYNINIYDLWDGYLHDDLFSIPLSVIFAAIFQYIAIAAGVSLATETLDFLLGKGERSLPLKLYPIRTILANLISFVFACFSFGTSAYFIDSSKHFNGDGELAAYKNFFLAFAILSPVAFNLFGGVNFVRKLGELLIEFWGVEHKKDKAHFALEMREFINELKYVMSNKNLIKSIEMMDPQTRRDLFPLPPHKTVETLLAKAKGEFQEEESNSLVMDEFIPMTATTQDNSSNQLQQTEDPLVPAPQATSHWYNNRFFKRPSLPSFSNPLKKFTSQGYSTVSQDDDDDDDEADNNAQSAAKTKGRCAVM